MTNGQELFLPVLFSRRVLRACFTTFDWVFSANDCVQIKHIGG